MLIAEILGLNAGAYSTTFQSRLTRHWLKPFTDETLDIMGIIDEWRTGQLTLRIPE